MKLSQLYYFLDAVESHSLHKSAERCNISVQGISKAIRCLEEELGVTLVTRTSKGIFLTETGEYLAEKFYDMIKTYEEITEYCKKLNVSTNKQTIKGEIRIAVTTRFIDSYFGKIMNKFRVKYPEIKIYVETFDNVKIIGKIKETGTTNLGIVSIIESKVSSFNMEEYIKGENLYLSKFYKSEMFLCGTIKTISKFEDKIYKMGLDYKNPVVSYRYGVDFLDETQYQLNSISAQKEMITNQGALGAFTLDEFNIHFNKKRYAYIPFDHTLMLSYGFIRKKDYELTQAEELFVEFLINSFVFE